jgi:hypothetical protein
MQDVIMQICFWKRNTDEAKYFILLKLHIPTLLAVNHKMCLLHENCEWMQKIKEDIVRL